MAKLDPIPVRLEPDLRDRVKLWLKNHDTIETMAHALRYLIRKGIEEEDRKDG